MSEYQELIKNIQKSRNYVRDFLIYGFKSREDFSAKSGRTYDNERRRIESWLSEYIRTDYGPQGKTLSLALDSNLLHTNPLYRVWKSRSFTSNDLMLHFFFLDLFRDGSLCTAEELTDQILRRYDVLFESQLIRKKANEYVKEGILTSEKSGRRLLYSLAPSFQDKALQILPSVLNAARFCQLAMPFGFIGSTILDRQKTQNETFLVKHGYCSFTLEDEILFCLLTAIRKKYRITFQNHSNKKLRSREETFRVIPMKIFVSTRTGRRFLCCYQLQSHRFTTYRLDQIQRIKLEEPFADYDYYLDRLNQNLPSCFGVSFGTSHRMDTIRLLLYIQEKTEHYIFQRLQREGRGGTITRTGQNTYCYEITVFDGNELMPWIKTFIGRILSFSSNNKVLQDKFYQDLHTMMQLYEIEES